MIGYRNARMPAGASARMTIGTASLVFLPAFLLFSLGAVTDISLPGVYMDAVNPDYLVVRLLNPEAAANVSPWTLPGNLLLGRGGGRLGPLPRHGRVPGGTPGNQPRAGYGLSGG